MRTIRLLAAATIGLVGAYVLFRFAVARCEGAGCDAYIPLSLLLPLLVLAMVAITGAVATLMARTNRTWFGILLAVTLLGVLGPVASLVIFRDQPDVLVPVATTLELLVAIAVFAYSSIGRRSGDSGAVD